MARVLLFRKTECFRIVVHCWTRGRTASRFGPNRYLAHGGVCSYSLDQTGRGVMPSDDRWPYRGRGLTRRGFVCSALSATGVLLMSACAPAPATPASSTPAPATLAPAAPTAQPK